MGIFVTGATGYLGSAVCRLLREQGIEVSGLARSPEAAVKLRESGVIPVEADLASADALAAAAQKADGVIHAGFQWGPEAGAVDRERVQRDQDRCRLGAGGGGGHVDAGTALTAAHGDGVSRPGRRRAPGVH